MFNIEDIRREYDRLDKKCGVNTKGINLVFSSRMRKRLGCCQYRKGMPVEIRIAENIRNSPDMFYNVIRHEYAHALVLLRNPKEYHGHDEVWRQACIEVGCDTTRTMTVSEDVKALQKTQYKYCIVCQNCGVEFHYYRITKAVKALKENKRNFTCPYCHSYDLTLKDI